MSIVVFGRLTIREIFGRNGPFKVGRLITQLGEFSVKDALLDQYEPGTYDGNFGIARIYPSYYAASGRIIVEVRALLENMMLSGIDDQLPPEETAFTEPDPADSEVVSPPLEKANPPPLATESKSISSDPDSKLFGSLMPLGDSIKLDPVVDRKILRAQCDRLKTLGYKFQPATQVWNRP